jgi:hypothetical protein
LTFFELLLVGTCLLLALSAIGMRFAVRELREIRHHLAAEKTHQERRI